MAAEGSLLPQFLFASNLTKTVRLRERIANDLVRPNCTNGLIHHFRSLHRYTVELFRLSHFNLRFRTKIQDALFDKAQETALQQNRNLNWCREVKKLVPLKTNGDGNCLLHATSQFMWGIQDIDPILRRTLWEALKETDTRNFKLRWQIECVRSQEFEATGLQYDTKNWDEEWEKVVKMSSVVSHLGQPGLPFDSLEEIHIFVLANILKRPIIVIADRVLRSFGTNTSLAPLHFGGIYLPLHWPPQECYKYPIVLGYDMQHFSPLVTINDRSPEIRAVPLVHNESRRFEEFTVHFLIPKEEENKAKLLEDYFSLIEIPVQGVEFGTTHLIKAARLDEGNLPEDLNLVEDYYQLVNHEYKRWQQNPAESNRPAHNQIRMNNATYLGSLIEEKCATYGCLFYCSVETKPFCHECFEQAKSTKMDSNPKNGEQQQKKKGCCRPRTELVITATTPTEPERSSRPRSAPPTAPSLSLFSETNAMKCKVPNCPFTLNVQHNGLCERCFKTRSAVPGNTTDNRTAEVRMPCHRESSSERVGSTWENTRTKQGAGNLLHQEHNRCDRCHQDTLPTINGLCNMCLLRTFQGNSTASHEDSGSFRSGHERSHSDPSQIIRNMGHLSPPDQYQTSHVWTSAVGPQVPQSSQKGRATYVPEESKEGFQPCKNSGCHYFGTKEHEGYCTICFIEYRRNLDETVNQNRMQRNVQPSHRPPQTDPRFQNMARCQGKDCNTFGNSHFEGYCQKCFIDTQYQRYNEATGSRGHSSSNASQHRPSDRNELRSQRIKCAKNYCNSYVTSSEGELCLECRHNNRGITRDPLLNHPPKQRCHATGCDHFGNNKCNGYCNECYAFISTYGRK